MPFTAIPGTKLTTPGNIVPGAAGRQSAISGSILFTANVWQGGTGGAFPFETTTYVRVPVTAQYTNGQPYDPTPDVVLFTFIGPYATTQQAADYPPTDSTTWTRGSWDPNASTPTAILLVGQNGTVTLQVGSYQVWIKIIDSPEEPVLWAGGMIVS